MKRRQECRRVLLELVFFFMCQASDSASTVIRRGVSKEQKPEAVVLNGRPRTLAGSWDAAMQRCSDAG
jgi:hypothetical protein